MKDLNSDVTTASFIIKAEFVEFAAMMWDIERPRRGLSRYVTNVTQTTSSVQVGATEQEV